MSKRNNLALVILISGIFSVTIGFSLALFDGIYAPGEDEIVMNSNYQFNVVTVTDNNNQNDSMVMSYTSIPTYNQKKEGYHLGCEGVSLFMALKGLGYIENYTIDEFMDTMPYGNNPYQGFWGNPTIGHYGENAGKRTTIYPGPLSKWANQFATAEDLTGASIDDLKKELSEGHVLLVFVTTAWKNPIWKKYPWSINPKGEVENNHCLTVVGFNSNGDFLVNDCHDGSKDNRQGEYWVKADVFAKIYNARKYAVSVY